MKELFGEKMYSADDVAELLGVSMATANKMFRIGTLNGVKIKRTWYITEGNMKEFLLQGNNERG